MHWSKNIPWYERWEISLKELAEPYVVTPLVSFSQTTWGYISSFLAGVPDFLKEVWTALTQDWKAALGKGLLSTLNFMISIPAAIYGFAIKSPYLSGATLFGGTAVALVARKAYQDNWPRAIKKQIKHNYFGFEGKFLGFSFGAHLGETPQSKMGRLMEAFDTASDNFDRMDNIRPRGKHQEATLVVDGSERKERPSS